MFNLEKAIKEWKKSLRRNEALEDGYIAELESHIRDEVDKGIREGKEEEASFLEAIKKLGEADSLGEEFYKTDTRHINKRPPWKESKWLPVLLGHYLKVAKRNIFRQKGYSFINIFGFALGMACCILLFMRVHHEFSFDKFHKNADNIYRIEMDSKTLQGIWQNSGTPSIAGPVFSEQIPGMNQYTRVSNPERVLLDFNGTATYENKFTAVDTSFFRMFTFKILLGNSETALNKPFSMVLSETLSKKYFGNENPIGKVITLDKKAAFTITGVIEDPPLNSTIRPEIIIPFDNLADIRQIGNRWFNYWYNTWVIVEDDSKIAGMSKMMTDIALTNLNSKAAKDPVLREDITNFPFNQIPKYKLTPLAKIHLYNTYGPRHDNVNEDFQTLKIYAFLAMLILSIACINYINLATARAANRAKEIGIRKSAGAQKKHIIFQFFGESLLFTLISFTFSVIIAILLMPLFNDLTSQKFTFASLINFEFIGIIFATAVLAGIISAIYPALLLSSFSPEKVLRGGAVSGIKGKHFRKPLVILQFGMAVILFLGTVVIYQQVNYMRTQKVGYDKENLVYVPMRGQTNKSYSLFRNELLKSPYILNVGGISAKPTDITSSNDGVATEWEGEKLRLPMSIHLSSVDYDFIETMKIPLVEGRSFSRDFPSDTLDHLLVNEELLKAVNTKSGVGKIFKSFGDGGQIVGVMKNFNGESVQNKIAPLFLAFTSRPRNAVIRVQGGTIPQAMEKIKSVWTSLFPKDPYEYKFVNDDFDKMYKADEQFGKIIQYGAIISIVIACLGLFGFASFMAEKRTKEIGIRKTLGASVKNIMGLLTKEFVKWVLIANIIAWPVAYYLMDGWLQDYAVRITIKWWVFGLTGAATVLIALLTVSFQSAKAALSNPVKSLRSE